MAVKTLLSPFHRFAREERGAIMLETIIMLPILIWALFAMAAYWDVYRTINRQQKAAYAIADIYSRKTQVPDTYFGPLDDVMNYMLDDGQQVRMRLTNVQWSDANNRFEVGYSRSPGMTMPEMTTAMLQAVAHKIPAMTEADRVILLETEISYQPNINVPLVDAVGVTAQTLKQFIVTKPRFGGGKTCIIGLPTSTC
jgi:hypothetical protein